MPAITRAAFSEESAEVEVLIANMDKLKTLTRKIQGSIQRLETSGKSVQDAIQPINGNSAKLQITTSNIDRINNAIEKIKKPLDMRQQEEAIIRPGIQRTGNPAHLESYLASMDRTYQALGELKNSNLRSNQHVVEEFNDLLRVGSKELATEFRDTLRQESRPLEPLHYITKKIPFPSISAQDAAKLRDINKFADATKDRGASKQRNSRTGSIYTDVRGPYIKAALQNLAIASVATVKKTDPNAIYRKGTCGISTYCLAIQGIFAAEYDNVREIFTPEQWAGLPTRVCHESLVDFTATLRDLHAHIKQNLLTDCFLAFEIIQVVSSLAHDLEVRGLDVRSAVEDALRPIFETAKASLRVMLEDTRMRITNITNLVPDGAPLPLVSEVMTRLQTLTDYQTPLATILHSLGESGWRASLSTLTTSAPSSPISPPTPYPGSENLLSMYISDTLDALVTNLDPKAKALLKTKSTQGVFLANNIALIDRGIATSPSLAALIPDQTRLRLDAQRKKAGNLYADAWREPSIHLHDVQYTNRTSATSSKASGAGGVGSVGDRGGPNAPGSATDSVSIVKALSNKEKDALKEKFRLFNTSFDELVQRHRNLKMEREVRPVLTREVQSLIEPLYARFWDRYHEVDKGKGKYVRFDKAGLVAALTGMG